MPIFRMSRLQEDRRIRIGCHRMLVELPETFQRRVALLGAKGLADNIARSFESALLATRNGCENAEDQSASVREAAEQLENASTALQETIARSRGVRIEWTESLDRMGGLLSGMRETIGRMAALMAHLGEIQGMLDEVGFQTNISSLNAIVNAARTEQKGEIFAAVAEEARKASMVTKDHIREMLTGINRINTAIDEAGDLFARFDAAMADFRNTSDAIIAMTGDIAAFSESQENTLLKIKATIKAIGRYTHESRNRYRFIGLKEADIRGYLANLDDIIRNRMGFWGPFRLNKTISLDNQRINVKGIRGLVDRNKRLIDQERADLEEHHQAIVSAMSQLRRISDEFSQFTDTVAQAAEMMERKASEGLERISEQGRRFSDKTRRITEFLDHVERMKHRMQGTILFNDVLPLVAHMAALLAEGENDLKFRVAELNALLHKLRKAIRDIDDFLISAGREVTEMDGMCAAMASEIEQNHNAAIRIQQQLREADETATRQRGQIDAIADALAVIQAALDASRSSADGIDTETERLGNSIRDYIGILDRRKDRDEEDTRLAGSDTAHREVSSIAAITSEKPLSDPKRLPESASDSVRDDD